MQWAIGYMGSTAPQDELLIDALSKRGRTPIEVKQVPFTDELLGFDQIDRTKPVILWCSTQMIEKVATEGLLNPEPFYSKHWFDPRYAIGKRSDLLNPEMQVTTVRELRQTWVNEPLFVKSVTVKALNGQVLEPVKTDWDRWLIEHAVLDGDVELVLAPVVPLEREWRFFVLGGEIVTGSTYRKDGYRSSRHPVSEEAWEAAKYAVTQWMPSPDIVIDLARTREGQYKVVEFNALHSSGFYGADVGRLVDRWEARTLKRFSEKRSKETGPVHSTCAY